MSVKLGLAISWKFNDVSGVQTVNGKITKFPKIDGVALESDGFPSAEDQAKWVKEYEDYLAATEYQLKRKEEYPSFEDQLDDIYHNGIDKWKETIKAVKDKYPKP